MKKQASSQLSARGSKKGRIVRSGLKTARVKASATAEKSNRLPFPSEFKALEPNPPDLLLRLSAIPLLFNSREPKRTVSAGLAEDSWVDDCRVGLRDLVDGHIRRIAFVAGKYRFELVAERRANQWEFVGRVYLRNSVLNDLVLVLGRQRLSPGVGGFFHWTSKRVVRRLSLISSHRRFTLESILW